MSQLLHGDLTESIIGAAIEVHRHLGPGLLESAYRECLCEELGLRGIEFEREMPLPILYKGKELNAGYRLDIVVARLVVVELKSLEKLLPIHEAQLLTYMRLGDYKVGLLFNFNQQTLKEGMIRRVL